MNVSSLATIITAVAACGAAGAALRGLRYAKSQIDTAVNDHQVDRVLALYRDFTSGEVGAARDRFSDLMFRAGEKAFGPRKCWRPELESLIPAYPTIGNDHSSSRFLGSYPKDMAGAEGNRPISDLRQGRSAVARRRTGLCLGRRARRTPGQHAQTSGDQSAHRSSSQETMHLHASCSLAATLRSGALARRVGVTARLLPFTVDGLIWAASMVVLDASRRN
jgi:hypothetical protein